MSSSDNVSKISLAMLRGKSSTQSVPSISFRFNPGSDDLVKISEKEENEKENVSTSAIPEFSPDREKVLDVSRESSPLRRDSKGLNQRSSSLDETANLSPDAPTSKTSDASSLISRITKTFEHKINEIRSEKIKEKDTKLQGKESIEYSSQDQSSFSLVNSDSEKPGPSGMKALDSMKRFSLDNKDNTEVSSSPSKSKTTLVQDFTEQKNKLKSDFNKSIRPKISELRNRKSVRDSGGSPKIKSSLLQSILGRDENLINEELLHECHAVDAAVEAYEEVVVSVSSEKETNTPIINQEGSVSKAEEEDSVEVMETSSKYRFRNITPDNYKIMLRLLLFQWIEDFRDRRPSFTGKGGLCLFAFCFILPLPRFIAGAILGASLMGIVLLYLFQKVMPVPEELQNHTRNILPLSLRNEENLMHVGWMNELDTDYYPESYHVSQTHTVLLRLQGSILQIDNSRIKISKHAKPNEEPKYGGFVHHREYDLAGCEVLLLPKNLPRRWLWSRKYPIFIRLQQKLKSSPSSPPSRDSVESTSTVPFQETSSVQHSSDFEANLLSAEESQTSESFQSAGTDDEAMASSVDLGSYEEVTQDMCEETSLCLFARTDREKDDWFRRFVAASEKKAVEKKICNASPSPVLLSSTPETEVSVLFESVTAIEGESFRENGVHIEGDTETKEGVSIGGGSAGGALSFEQHMALIMDQVTQAEVGVSWFNSFIGRVLFDFLHDKFWANKVQERIQRKLSKLHIPYFVGEIVVSGIDLGNYVPQLVSAGRPTIDHRGLWTDFELSYSGSFKMTLETKLDLMKLKARSPSGATSSNPPSPGESPGTSHHTHGGRGLGSRAYARSPSSDCVLRNVQFDTDTDDSVESSSEEESVEDELGERVPGGGPASRRFLRIVDTVATSKYFQQASEWRLLQKAMKGVSNTRIELGVEVRWLKGTLTLNVPPAPSDRIWYGFRGSPELVMVAKPCLGDRQLDTLPFLAEFIQKQLRIVFEKVFVLPNMDDLVIPIMSPLLPGQKSPPRPPWDQSSIISQGGNPPTPSPKTSPTKRNVSLDMNQSFLKLSKSVGDQVSLNFE